MSLYQKYRPATFDDVAGAKNRATVATLRALLDGDDPPHAVLLFGPRGCGKTSLGRLITQALGCSDADYREVDSADFRGIDTIREIRRNAQYMPMNGTRRVWLLDECHRVTKEAQDALLKCLEDPPPHAYFVLCTTDPDKLLPTIRSRCSAFPVHQLAEDEMLRLLGRIAAKEGASLPKSTLQKVVDAAHGHCRDALQMLEQLIADPEAVVASLDEAKAKTLDLCRALLQSKGWKAVSAILADLKDEDVEGVRRAVLGYCSSVLLREEDDRAMVVMDQFVDPFYDSGFPGLVHAAYCVVNGGDPGV